MAEYVRRKRPPATHPYWERLRDRAHPPSRSSWIGFPAVSGLFLGLVGGLAGEFTYGQAQRTVFAGSAAVAVLVFLVALLCLYLDPNPLYPQHRRWLGTLVASSACAAGTFVLIGMLLSVFTAVCWVFSGRGPWVGGLLGLAVGGAIGSLFAAAARRRWRERQRQWPRWERMRAPRRSVTLTVTPVRLPAEDPPAAEPGRDPSPERKAGD